MLGIALPWLIAGMQMEITAFLGWIELHRRCGRGVRLLSVQALMTERHKAGVFIAQALAAWALLLASGWPTPLGARVAGFALAGSQALLCWRMLGVGRDVRAFVAGQGARSAVAKEGMRTERIALARTRLLIDRIDDGLLLLFAARRRLALHARTCKQSARLPLSDAMRVRWSNRLPRTACVPRVGRSISSAGPPSRTERRHSTVPSRSGSTGRDTRARCPSRSSRERNERRS
jgi:hypothetical protein